MEEASKGRENQESFISVEDLTRVDEIIASYKDRPGALIPVLQKSQEVCGYLPKEVQTRIATGLNIPSATVYGVVSFYSFFTMVPKGRHTIRICLGTACFVKGSKRMLGKLQTMLGISVGEMTDDRKFSLDTVRCLGACGLAPTMVIDNDTYGMLDPIKIVEALKRYE